MTVCQEQIPSEIADAHQRIRALKIKLAEAEQAERRLKNPPFEMFVCRYEERNGKRVAIAMVACEHCNEAIERTLHAVYLAKSNGRGCECHKCHGLRQIRNYTGGRKRKMGSE